MAHTPVKRAIIARRSLHLRDEGRRQQRDPLAEVGLQIPYNGPGLISDQGRLNVPDEKDIPENAEADSGDYVQRRRLMELGVHLPPVSEGSNQPAYDYRGVMRVNPSAGGRVHHRTSGTPIVTVINQAVEYVFLDWVTHLEFQAKHATANFWLDFDAVASKGSLKVAAGTFGSRDVRCKTVWIYCDTDAVNINGTSDGNFYLAGWN